MNFRNRALNALVIVVAAAAAAQAMAQSVPLTGSAAFGDWRTSKPGVRRLIKPEDLPKPGATPSSANVSHVVERPAKTIPQVPDGFKIALFAAPEHPYTRELLAAVPGQKRPAA